MPVTSASGEIRRWGLVASFTRPNILLITWNVANQTAYPITIGEDCWLGGGVVVCPGVTIGNRCVIAAGSVVVKDIPDDSLAAGCPAVVKKRLNGKAGVVEQ